MKDSGDLAALHDIIGPAGFPFWPLAPGAWIISATILALIMVAAWQSWQQYRANAYRRLALRELDALLASPTSRDFLPAVRVSTILKRVALVSFPRELVAGLTGKSWSDFIATRKKPGTPTDTITGILANDSAMFGWQIESMTALSAAERALIIEAKIWIRSHKAAKEG